MSKFEDLLKQLGTGKWNILAVVAMWYWIPQNTAQSMGAALMAPDMNYTCRVPEGVAVDARDNDTSWQCKYNTTSPAGNTEEHACTEWDYDNSTFTNTVTSEFNLVCEQNYLKASFKSVYFFGTFFGSALNGWLSDRFGRKMMLSIASVIYTIMANILPWLPNIYIILFVRFIMGFMEMTSIVSGYTLAMEVTELRYRAVVGILLYLPWAICVIILGGYGYLLRDWRWFTVTISLPSLLFIPVLWFLDESPRWLIVRGRFDDALRVLEKAARWNKAQLPPEVELRSMMNDIKKEARVTSEDEGILADGFWNSLKNIGGEVIVLVRTKGMRTITLSIYGQYFILGIVYYGLSFGADQLGVDPFVYMAVSGVMEVPGGTITIPMVEKLGRRASCTVSFLVTAASLLTLGFIPSRLVWLVVTMAMLGRLTITCAYQVVILYATEIFPTEVRVRGVATSGMLSSVGAMLAPFMLENLGAIKSWLPLVVFGIGSLLASVATFWLPESRSAPMFDTVASLEAVYGAGRKGNSSDVEMRNEGEENKSYQNDGMDAQ